MDKKICLVIPSLQAGGMERVMSELAWHFSTRKEIELHLVLYGIKQEIFYAIPDNITVHKPEFRFKNAFRLYYTLKTLGYLRKTICRIKPDTILSFGEYWNSFILLALMFKEYPVYVSDRSQPNKSLGRFHDQLRKWLYPRSAGVILQSQKAKDIYQQKFNRLNIRVIGNPIREIKASMEIKIENIILTVGRLIKSKHHDSLIRIFALLENKDWKLVLVGYDHLKQNIMEPLKKLAEDLGVSDRVIFAGKQSNVEEYYLKSKIFAFTSSSEGFPNAIGEAMSAGLPVVSYDCIAGPSEMIADGENGYLVPVFDDKKFQEKLQKLMSDEALIGSMGDKAKKSIQKFSIETIGKEYLNFILDENTSD